MISAGVVEVEMAVHDDDLAAVCKLLHKRLGIIDAKACVKYQGLVGT